MPIATQSNQSLPSTNSSLSPIVSPTTAAALPPPSPSRLAITGDHSVSDRSVKKCDSSSDSVSISLFHSLSPTQSKSHFVTAMNSIATATPQTNGMPSPTQKSMLRVETHHQAGGIATTGTSALNVAMELSPTIHSKGPIHLNQPTEQTSTMSPSSSSSSTSSSLASVSGRTNDPMFLSSSSTSPISTSPPTLALSLANSSVTPIQDAVPLRNVDQLTGYSSQSSSSGINSVTSSVDSSPQLGYRAMQINVTSVNSATGTKDVNSIHVDVEGDGDSSASSGSDDSVHRDTDAMQISTPHPQAKAQPPPPSTTTATIVTATKAPLSVHVNGTVTMNEDHSTAAGANGSTPAGASTTKDTDMIDAQTPANKSATAATAQHDGSAPITGTTLASSGPSATPIPSSSVNGSSRDAGRDRYESIRVLQASLFGQVQLATDHKLRCQVAIKVSHSPLANPKSNMTPAEKSAAGTPSDADSDGIASAHSKAGVAVLEDVRREARVLKLLLGGEESTAMAIEDIDDETCGFCPSLLRSLHLPKHGVPDKPGAMSIREQFMWSFTKGRRYIAKFFDEVETESYHYLISEFIANGDLFSVLTAQPQHKVSESVGRSWMYEMCASIRYLHAQSVAHLDLSLENVCLDGSGHCKLIDFGLASQHPLYQGAKRVMNADGVYPRNASKHLRLVNEPFQASQCTCGPCTISNEELLAAAQRRQQKQNARFGFRVLPEESQSLKFLCRPICTRLHKPGKLGYLSPELYENVAWCAYKADVFALGVILYSILTGRPPFTRPDLEEDVWFRVIYSGEWLSPGIRSQAPARVYNNLSPEALSLIDAMIKPQHLRPTIDQVMRHEFLAPNAKSTAAPAPTNKPSGAADFKSMKSIKRSGSA